MNAVETRKLTKNYGKNRGIDQVDLVIPEGDIFGFIGPNGAGKSTTIRLLLGMLKPTSGEACIFGDHVGKKGKKVRAQVGYMPSEAQFYPGLRVEEVIRLSADLHKSKCKQEAGRLCDRFELDRKKRIEELSLGNRKKVALVCALQHSPKLVILDEPTSGLDPLMQREFFEEIKEQNKKGVTIFFSSHVLSEIQEHCRHAAIIREGKLIRSASVEELTKTSAKIVTVRGTTQGAILQNEWLRPGIVKLQEENGALRFFYEGETKKLLHGLAAEGVSDVNIADPGLEELILHYYQEGARE